MASNALAVAVDRLAAAAEDTNAMRRAAAAAAAREAREEKERRRIGSRSGLRKLDFLTMARAVPGLAEQFAKKIPSEFWTLDDQTAIVSCPCGETPESEVGVPSSCSCDRIYLYDGEAVRVTYAPLVDNECEAAGGDGDVGEQAGQAA